MKECYNESKNGIYYINEIINDSIMKGKYEQENGKGKYQCKKLRVMKGGSKKVVVSSLMRGNKFWMD